MSTARQFKACDHLRDKMHVSTAARLICCKAQLVQQPSYQPSKAGMLLYMYWQLSMTTAVTPAKKAERHAAKIHAVSQSTKARCSNDHNFRNNGSNCMKLVANCSESTQDPESRIPVSRILRSLAARLDLLKRIQTFKCACTMCYPRNGHALP